MMSILDEITIDNWNNEFRRETPDQTLRFFLNHFKGKIALSSSLGQEDQVLTEIVTSIDPKTRIFTLDTGRLFPETYELIDRTSSRFQKRIEVYFPDPDKIEEMVNQKGVNLFYESIENRRRCCSLRKIEPLTRALQGLDAWITGLRQGQGVTRNQIKMIEWDGNNRLLKINPLIHWATEEVNAYINKKDIPVNPLHQRGFASIGCQPCTRAIKPGEDLRAGRWWWENPETRECGLHNR
jgi:phosphoadenosine phosphosulfate reductase